MTKPTRIPQPKLDELLLSHRRSQQKELKDKHSQSQRNILIRKMRLARKQQARDQAKAMSLIEESTDQAISS